MRQTVTVKETKAVLQKLKTACSRHQYPRVKMLLALLSDSSATNESLAATCGASVRSVARWLNAYIKGGLEGLLGDGRGGDKRSGISAEQKQAIERKLSNPKGAFCSYGEAQAWLRSELGIAKEYHALNKYLKRNWAAKLKVGRKSHVKKDEAAVAVFKKPARIR